MKYILRYWVVLILLVSMISCACTKDKNTISGKVVAVERGKDGYTATVNTDKSEVYLATISIVNIGGQENYKQVKVGDVVSLKGDIWKTEPEKHIKVKEIIWIK